MNNLEKRKLNHLKVFNTYNPVFSKTVTGFDKYRFLPHTVNDISLKDVKTETYFLGRKLSFPFMIGSMSGGIKEAYQLNSDLSAVAENLKIAFALGSFRPILESGKIMESYSIARKNAPSVPILANIGIGQITKGEWKKGLLSIIDDMKLDGLFIHFNKLQEYIQKDGNTNFDNLENEIRKLIDEIEIPVIAKEVGNGFFKKDIESLINWGFKYIDVSGAGGTSWAKVENLLVSENKKINSSFFEWGIPTSESLKYLTSYKQIFSIASGGIDEPEKMAKSLAFGANIACSARFIYQMYYQKGVKYLENELMKWQKTLKAIMYLTGINCIDEFIGNKEILSEIDE